MLPERISNDLCSLRAREDRAALAVRMVIGADGRKRSHTFHRIMMRSAAKLSYQQTQFAIGGRTDDDTDTLVEPVLKPLYAAYEALKIARAERGPLDLDLPERKILLKHDGTVDRVVDAGAAGGAPADRGIHDPRQCRRRRDAGEGARAADLPRARRADDGEAARACANSSPRSTFPSPRAAWCAPPPSTPSSPASKAATPSNWSTKWCCAARRRPNMRRKITDTSASICAATRISPRRSAAMPT